MNNFKCFLCDDTFEDVNKATKHLKEIHKLKDSVDSFRCVIGECTKSYTTLGALKRHCKQCKPNM